MYAKIAILAAVAAFATAAPAAVENGTFVPGELGPEGDVMPMIASCTDCLSNGLAWNKATKECVKLGCKSADCVNDIRMCHTKPVKPVKPVAPIVPDCEEAEPVEKPMICTNLPAGLCKGDVMVAGVAYTVEEPIFGCEGKKACKETNVWCEVEESKKHPGTFVEKYTYCCGSNCKGMPEEQLCEVNGKNYTVGVAYENVKINDKKVTMWCLSEDEYVTCKGKKCGSTPELTPPGIDVCPVPKPVIPIDTPAAGNAPLPPNPTYKNCISCIENGGSWNENKLECYPGGNNGPDAIMCPFGADDSCHADIGRCPMPIGESMAL